MKKILTVAALLASATAALAAGTATITSSVQKIAIVDGSAAFDLGALPVSTTTGVLPATPNKTVTDAAATLKVFANTASTLTVTSAELGYLDSNSAPVPGFANKVAYSNVKLGNATTAAVVTLADVTSAAGATATLGPIVDTTLNKLTVDLATSTDPLLAGTAYADTLTLTIAAN